MTVTARKSVFAAALGASAVTTTKTSTTMTFQELVAVGVPNDSFCYAMSLLDFWDIEADMFKVNVDYSKKASGRRVSNGVTTNVLFMVCHGTLGSSIQTNDRVVIPFQYLRHSHSGTPWRPHEGLGQWQEPSNYPAKCSVKVAHAVPFEIMRSFYFWLTSDRNPIWCELKPHIAGVEVYRKGKIPYGVSFVLNDETLKARVLMKQFLCQTRFLSESHLKDISQYRRDAAIRLRKGDQPAQWAVVCVVGESYRASGHNFLAVNEKTLYNFVKHKRVPSESLFSDTYNLDVPLSKEITVSQLQAMTPESARALLKTWKV